MNKKRIVIGCLLLIIITVLPYVQSHTFEFIRLDDMGYIPLNPFVRTGLTWKNVETAWTAIGYAGNWHPLTWMSLQVDISLFGLNPGIMHLHNAVLHGLNTVLLFFVLLLLPKLECDSLRKTEKKSLQEDHPNVFILIAFFIALLWGIHPLRVEAVAWVCERKEVLSVFWSLTAILLYFQSICKKHKTLWFMLSSMACFLAITAKPVAVSVPVILGIYDICYYRKIRITKCLTWLVLCTLCCVFTSLAQQEALARLEMLSISRRLFNALASIGIYVWQIIDIRHLAIFYPFRDVQPILALLGGGGIVISIIIYGVISLIRLWRKGLSHQQVNRILGCVWCSVGLIPMLGIIQVGSQAHADRYTYWVGCGFAVFMLTGIQYLVQKINCNLRSHLCGSILFGLVTFLGIATVIFFGYYTFFQIRVWKNSQTVYEHAKQVISNNAWANWSLADYYASQGDTARAELLYRKAIEINPNDIALGALAVFKAVQSGESLNEAFSLASRALYLNPRNMDANEAMGILALRAQAWAQAENYFKISLKTDSQRPFVLAWLAMALHNQKKYGEACTMYEKALNLMPEYLDFKIKYEQTKRMLNQRQGVMNEVN